MMLLGFTPYKGDSDDEVYEELRTIKIDFNNEIYDTLSFDAKELLKKMLEYDPDKRIDAISALNSQFFHANND